MSLTSVAVHSSTDWLALLCWTFLSYLILYPIYTIFFHPLSHCPGPLLCKLSSLPSFYHALKGDRHIWLWQCSQIYGDKIRIAPNSIVFLHPNAYRDIYRTKANVKKSKFYEAWSRHEHDINTLSTTDPAAHAKRKKMLNQAFTEKSLRAAGGFIAQHVDRWNEILLSRNTMDEEWSEPLNMATWIDYLVFDILGDLCFGKSFDIKEPGPNAFREIPHHIIKFLKFYYPITRSPLLSLVIYLKPLGLNRLFELITPPEIKNYYAFLEASLTARLQQEEEKENQETETPSRLDMLHFLHAARKPDTGEQAFSTQDLLAETNLLVAAGSDTTSITLCALFFYLTRNARVYDALVNEIRTTFDRAEEIVNGAKLASCRYLEAVIIESMRMAPPGPSELSREVRPGGAVINGEMYPGGTVVGSGGWAFTHNESTFGVDANIFRPERWIPSPSTTGVTEEDVGRLRDSYHPFLIGPGVCAGRGLAMLELRLVVARTVWRLDVRRSIGDTTGEGRSELGWGRRDSGTFMIEDAFVAVRDGPVVQFRRRKE